MNYYKIGEIAERTGVSSGRLRLWEKKYNLIKPLRTVGGFRLYDAQAIGQVTLMKELLEEGWTVQAATLHVKNKLELSPPQTDHDLTTEPAKKQVSNTTSFIKTVESDKATNLNSQLTEISSKLDKLLQGQQLVQSHPPNEQNLAHYNPLFDLLTWATNATDLLKRGLEIISQLLAADVAFVYLVDDKAGYIDLVARLNRAELAETLADEATHRRLGVGISGRVAVTGEPIFLADAGRDARVSTIIVREVQQAVGSVPIITPRKIYGVLTVAHLGLKHYDQNERELLINTGRLLGWAYENLYYQEKLANLKLHLPRYWQENYFEQAHRLLIVEKQSLFRASLVQILGSDNRLAVVAQTDRSSQVMELCQQLKPQVMLLDLTLSEPDSVSLVQQLKAQFADLKIILLAPYEDDARILAGFKAGAVGCLLKTARPDEFTNGIQSVLAGRYLLSPKMAEQLLSSVAGIDHNIERKTLLQALTERELNIVKGLARGNSTKLLAREMNISTKTLNQHISTIYRKLQVADRVQLALFAIQHDLT